MFLYGKLISLLHGMESWGFDSAFFMSNLAGSKVIAFKFLWITFHEIINKKLKIISHDHLHEPTKK